MLYKREDFDFVKDTFGQSHADLMMFHRRDEEIPKILHRIAIRKQADEFAARGYHITVIIDSHTSQAKVTIIGPRPTDKKVLDGSQTYLLVNDAIAIRDGEHSKVIPLRLADILFYYLPKDMWN